jgi:hypothetical protein
MKFWRVLPGALSHTFATLIATYLVWAIWFGWSVFVNGNHNLEWGGPWGTYRFGMQIALIVSLILSGGFLIMSFIYHYFRADISKKQHTLSSLTLALSSLILLTVLPNGGLPLFAVMIGLPILASSWMLARHL